MLLYVIRHGETEWNATYKVQGSVDVPLNENGISLAGKLADDLKDVRFDLAYTSPLLRARQTAEIVLAGRDVPLLVEPRLTEIDFGELEGTCVKRDKNDTTHPFYAFFNDAFHFCAPGGESISQVCQRTGEFYRELVSRQDLQDQTILISTHGCALRGFLHEVYDDPDDFWRQKVCPNCGLNIVEVTEGKGRLLVEDQAP